MNKPIKERLRQIYGQEPQTHDELGHAVVKLLGAYRSVRTIKNSSPNVLGLAWEVSYNNLVSNSHSAPEGHAQNWCGNADSRGVPRGYPGWSGRVWVRYADDRDFSFGSQPFSNTLTHTGTGGYGGYSGPWENIMRVHFNRYKNTKRSVKNGAFPDIFAYSWDFRIYAADWPLLDIPRQKQMVWDRLQGKSDPTEFSHKFHWEDPEQSKMDAEFMTLLAA